MDSIWFAIPGVSLSASRAATTATGVSLSASRKPHRSGRNEAVQVHVIHGLCALGDGLQVGIIAAVQRHQGADRAARVDDIAGRSRAYFRIEAQVSRIVGGGVGVSAERGSRARSPLRFPAADLIVEIRPLTRLHTMDVLGQSDVVLAFPSTGSEVSRAGKAGVKFAAFRPRFAIKFPS
jgi:hypothetical protein